MARRAAVPVFNAKEAELLPHFLAHYQGWANLMETSINYSTDWSNCVAYPNRPNCGNLRSCPPGLVPTQPSWLDSIMQEGDLRWVGGEKHTAAFCFEQTWRCCRAIPKTMFQTVRIRGNGKELQVPYSPMLWGVTVSPLF